MLTVLDPTTGANVALTKSLLNSILGSTGVSLVLAALVTVGAGVIPAVAVANGGTARGGVQVAAFTDTTDTAAAIIAAKSNDAIGTSWLYRYNNNTIWPATLAGGTGVTVSGATVLPPNSWVEYLVTYSAAGTITMQATGQGYYAHVGSYINNGATPVTVADANVTASSIISFTLKTAGGTVSPGAPNVKTITPGTGFTVSGVALDTSTYNYEIRG